MYHQNKKLFLFFSLCIFIISLTISSCKKEKAESTSPKDASEIITPKGMVWVEGKTFLQGAKEADKYAMPREKPLHKVTIEGFYIDITEVTNKQFKIHYSCRKKDRLGRNEKTNSCEYTKTA
jgi:sulfatase modifying factor 1